MKTLLIILLTLIVGVCLILSCFAEVSQGVRYTLGGLFLVLVFTSKIMLLDKRIN